MASRLFRSAALGAAAIASLVARPALAVDTIPYTDVKGGLIQVQGTIDGQGPFPMLVDLGAGVDVLSSALGRRFVLVGGKYVSLRLTGERVDLPVGKVLTFTMGGVHIDAPYVGVWGGLDGSGADGLISATAFRTITATFDFHNHNIVIEDAQTFPERVRMSTRVPLTMQDDLGIALGLFARFDFGGKIGLCEIDTGAQGVTIDKTFAASAGLDPGGAANGRVSSIALVGASQTKIDQPAVSFGNLIYDCNIGNSFWAGRSFTLDLPNHWLYVPPS